MVEDILANNSFIENLRMNSIFPPQRNSSQGDQSQGNPSPLIGMPDFNSGRRVPPYYGLQQVASHQTGPVVLNPRMNPDGSVVQPGEQQQQLKYTTDLRSPSDEFGNRIINGPSDRDKQLTLQSQIAGQKNTIGEQNVNINQQKADLARFKTNNPNMKFIVSKGGSIQAFNPLTGEGFDTGVDSGTLSDEEKQRDLIGSQRMEQIGAQGQNQQDLQNIRGQQQQDLQGVRGDQRLQQIGASITGNKSIADTRYGSPTQQKAAQSTGITQIQTTRPDLAKYLVKDPTTGQVQISQDTPLAELSMIQNIINPKANTTQGDIELPSGDNTNKTSTSSASPTAADLIKKYGG
jgi:hypothetical protein